MDGPVIEVGAGHGVVRLHVMASRYCQKEGAEKEPKRRRELETGKPRPAWRGYGISVRDVDEEGALEVYGDADDMVVTIGR